MPQSLIKGLILTAALARCFAAGEPSLSFEKDVRPILKTHCFHCHGEGDELKGKVDLRLRRFMVEAKTDDGYVLVPGKPSESLLFTMVQSGDMPKGEKKLATNDVAII